MKRGINKALDKLKYENTLLENLYQNLRTHFEGMASLILGENYYNMGVDVYTTDELTCKDILKEYDKVVEERDKYRVIARLSAGLWVAMAFLMILVWLFGGK